MKRILLMIGVVATLAVALASAAAAPASAAATPGPRTASGDGAVAGEAKPGDPPPQDMRATAQVCIFAPYGLVCNTTNGGGARVDSVDAIRDKASLSLICNYSADISVLNGRNHSQVKFFAHRSRTGCSPLRAWFTVPVHRTFACGDVVSVRWYEDDFTSGFANVKLC